MVNWREVPFIRLLLPFTAGILLAIQFNFALPFFHLILSGLLLLAFAIGRKRGGFRLRWLFGVLLNLLLLLLGYQLTWHHNELNHPNHISHYLAEKNLIIGKVDKMPVIKERVKIQLAVKGISANSDSIQQCIGSVLLFLPKDTFSEQLAYGDLLIAKGKLGEIEAPKNPKAFNYRRYLFFQNIHYQSFIKPGDWKLLDRNHGNFLLRTAFKLRSRFLQILKKHLPAENEFSVGSALILGYKDEITDEIRAAYAGTGAMHVLAVSGLHLGLIFLIINALLGLIKAHGRLWEWTKAVILFVSIWTFALLTGASPSAQRAATMLSFLIIGLALNRTTNSYNTLAASAFFLLLFNPYLVTSVGFQLSYLAVTGIVFFQPKITAWWKIKSKFGNYLWQLAAVSVAAQLMTLPLLLFYFHQFPIYFWLSGLVVVPAAAGILSLGLALFLAESFFPFASTFMGTLLYWLIGGVNKCIFLIQQLPGGLITGIWVSWLVVLLLYFLLGGVIVTINTKRLKGIVFSLAVLSTLSVGYFFAKLRQYQNKEIIVYHLYKKTAIDFIDGKHGYALVSEGIPERTLNFAVQNNRWAAGMKDWQTFYLEDTTARVLDTWFCVKGFVQFYGKKLAIVSQPFSPTLGKKIKVDFVVVRNNPSISMKELSERFDFEEVVFDASNGKWKVSRWKEECANLGITYYDVGKNGAWILKINGK